MISVKIYAFIFSMWILILIGGGLMVLFIGPISFPENIDPKITSVVKISLALFLIFIWVLILTKIKNWIFKSQLES
ncbi:MAG: hypothetical protein QF488_02945 [Candidatus Nitrosopelagicus sp.]|nr:hypothetical protein [Candidatus Nitrosopelagicus sp.]